MEFLQPYMKNRITVGCPSTSAPESRQLEEDDIGFLNNSLTLSKKNEDTLAVELKEETPNVKTNNEASIESNSVEPNYFVEVRPKILKKTKNIGDPVIKKYIEDSEK